MELRAPEAGDSDPAAEVAESWTKARPLLDAPSAGHTIAAGCRVA